MIEFYSLSKEDKDIFKQVWENVPGVVSIVLADMLNNNPKYKLHNECNEHPDGKNVIGCIWTGDIIEFFITAFCCEHFKEEMEGQIKILQRRLAPLY